MTLPSPLVKAFFEPHTSTVTYVVQDPAGRACAVIDPVLDYDPKAARISTGSADAIIQHVRTNGLEVAWLLETHAHADHLTAAAYLQERLGGHMGIGEHIREVQSRFGPLFDMASGFRADGSQFDRLFREGDTFPIGALTVRVLHTPGHTAACVTYLIGDAAFIGDTLFMPDYGTARADFPGGDARALFRSIRRILSLPADTRLFTGHDYRPGGRAARWESTVADQRAHNVFVRDSVTEDEFVERRRARDQQLDAPVLILPSLQVNIRAGRLPEPAANGIRYLRIPLDQLGRRNQ